MEACPHLLRHSPLDPPSFSSFSVSSPLTHLHLSVHVSPPYICDTTQRAEMTVVDLEARDRGGVDSSPVARGESVRPSATSATPGGASMSTQDSVAGSRDIDV